jgi:MoaA/NifB/PqqE/SkfB family radical SAM enzyme
MRLATLSPSLFGVQVLGLGVSIRPIRVLLRDILKRQIYCQTVEHNPLKFPVAVRKDKYAMVASILMAIDRGIERGLLGATVRRRLMETLLGRIFVKSNPSFEAFRQEHGWNPPAFIVLSPTACCNLSCPGCYAASAPSTNRTLPYGIVREILRQKQDLWGSHFTVISGGEPFVYKSEGKTLLDMFEEFSDQYFLVYTNGTLITRNVADRLGELGNVTPAISVEGLDAETDARRGKGCFAKILEAIENLRQAGVPFGVSATAMRSNGERILDDEFIDFFFERQGALYEWIFQYMPIGRGYDPEMMVTPQQRVAMWQRTWDLIREHQYFIVDFWNCGTASSGCIAAGSGIGGGFLYIDWNGSVAPCAFNPFCVHNVNDMFAGGGDLNTVLFSPFFEKIRNWQKDYFLNRPAAEAGNLLAPCPIRDHHRQMRDIIAETGAKAIDEDSARALEDSTYYERMVQYGRDIDEVSRGIWDEEYLKDERRNS